MLLEGALYDPAVHSDESCPRPRQPALIDAPSGTLRRRVAPDGTPYCCCCDTVLTIHQGRGRPAALCGACRDLRRRLKRAAFEATRQRSRRRAPHPDLARSSVVESSQPVGWPSIEERSSTAPGPSDDATGSLPPQVVSALHHLAQAMHGLPSNYLTRYGTTPEGKVVKHAMVIAAWHQQRFKTLR